jgi:hypothetical protein
VEDHHVDRPEVKAEQSVELTGTNRSIGLIVYSREALGSNAEGGKRSAALLKAPGSR